MEEWPGWRECSVPGVRGSSGELAVRYQVVRKGNEKDDGPLPLHDLFWCESCNQPRSRHPRDVQADVESFFCQQSLDNLPSSEASELKNQSPKVFQCPECPNSLSVQTMVDSENEGEQTCAFTCQHCRWDSSQTCFTALSPELLREKALQFESSNDEASKNMMSGLIKHFKSIETFSLEPEDFTSSPIKGESGAQEDQLWRWNECDAALNARKENVEKIESLKMPQAAEDLSALMRERQESSTEEPLNRLPLRTKLSYRCRECVQGNKPNIVLKPQINPLQGDSSMRRNVGAWFKKKSLAYDRFPRIVARIVEEGNARWMYVMVTNPCDGTMTLTIDDGARLTIDPYDEIEELDLWSGRRPPKPNSRKDDDPEIVTSRLANKVLLRLDAPEQFPWKPFISFQVAQPTEDGDSSALCQDLSLQLEVKEVKSA